MKIRSSGGLDMSKPRDVRLSRDGLALVQDEGVLLIMNVATLITVAGRVWAVRTEGGER